MDQKTIDDMVKALVEERLKQNTQQKSIDSPALVGKTLGKVRGPKKNSAKELDKDTEMEKKLAKEFDKDTWVKRTLAEEFDKDTRVKRTLAEEFGSVAKATDLNFGQTYCKG
ncbi:hypothetical protein DY000_02049921 [Brassica cretica]|uniref:Uncharacterized protein n=1 Tax=Brassica cretica TaxID=69181 RepID=A0ABQ7EV24_BRACR|nr:hypothetical protein DY000_02049921 [Brassica cretica]